jgi:glutamyl-tRNA synthetase/glutamyl-Q tRNA(Asp) synthetase
MCASTDAGFPIRDKLPTEMQRDAVSRFAPTTSGPAHPGTLLAALLCWLDARSCGGRILLRLEDLDPVRCRPEHLGAMVESLAWLGLDFDAVVRQSDHREAHEAVLDRLAEQDLLYPCRCSRTDLRNHAERARDGSFRYPGTCRANRLPSRGAGGWRALRESLRVRLAPGAFVLRDESGLELGGDPLADGGDPIVRRRDGAIAYHLASIVDDYDSGVTRVVRGRDLAPSTAVQVALQRMLGWPTPSYRHHLLLLEPRGDKLAKLHGSVGFDALRGVYTAAQLVGVLACVAGLRPDAAPVSPSALQSEFSWDRVGAIDRVLHWDGTRLIAS